MQGFSCQLSAFSLSYLNLRHWKSQGEVLSYGFWAMGFISPIIEWTHNNEEYRYDLGQLRSTFDMRHSSDLPLRSTFDMRHSSNCSSVRHSSFDMRHLLRYRSVQFGSASSRNSSILQLRSTFDFRLSTCD